MTLLELAAGFVAALIVSATLLQLVTASRARRRRKRERRQAWTVRQVEHSLYQRVVR